jgi:myo-inositol-1(or 4)-monophosphatase
MTPLELNELLDCALRSAIAGSLELETRYGTELEIKIKSNHADFVTDADVAAEQAVRKVILSLRPEDSVTGEELSRVEHPESKIRWSIDPLDGTVNFLRGIPFFATSVAAVDMETGDWLAGAVVAPALRLKYFASRGGGSFKESEIGTVQIFGPPIDRTTKIVGTGFSYSLSERTEQFGALPKVMPDFVDVRRIGSAALDICMVADGSLDSYFERHTKEHDWAAAILIAEEAGCSVVRPSSSDDAAYVNFNFSP